MQGKQIKGDKYIYLAMAYQLAKQHPEKSIIIGNDNGMKGGQNYYRRFTLMDYQDETLLIETKTSAHFADFKRVFVVEPNPERPRVYEYLNEHQENGSTNWTH